MKIKVGEVLVFIFSKYNVKGVFVKMSDDEQKLVVTVTESDCPQYIKVGKTTEMHKNYLKIESA